MKMCGLLLLLLNINLAVYAGKNPKCIPPTLIKPIENISIAAFNVVTIDTKAYFIGSNLIYTLQHKRIKVQNMVNIDQTNGKITIDAETKDKFDVCITIKNNCGILKNEFNVLINEENIAN